MEVFLDKNEAVVEFQSQADAAQLLLNSESFEFQGVQLRFSESENVPGRSHNIPAVGGGVFIPRNAASRPRAGLGRARNPSRVPAVGSQMMSDDSAPSRGKGKAQDDFRKMLLGGK